MRIIRAEHLGICFGMRDAVTLTLQQAECEPLTILGELVNNETVLAALRAKGIRLEPRVQDVGTRTVMVTAQNTQPIERVRHLVQPSGIRGGGVRRCSRPDDGPHPGSPKPDKAGFGLDLPPGAVATANLAADRFNP